MAYLFTAGFACAHYSLLAFRYFGKAERYDAYTVDKSSGTQWFELGSKMINFTSLAVYGVAFMTSLLALLGIAPSINYMVWFWGVMVLGGGANMIGEMLMFIGMDGAYSDWTNTATDVKTVAAAAIGGAVYVNIRQAMVEEAVTQTKIMYVLYNQSENWMWAMWDAMPEADKEAKVEEIMMEIEEWEAEQMAEMEAEMEMEEDAEESADDAEEADEDADEADKDADEADEDADEADEDADEADEDDFGGDDGFGDDDGFGGDDGFGDDDSFDDFFN